MLLTKEVNVKVNNSNIKRYESLGYKIPMRKASDITKRLSGKDMVYDTGNYITVNVNDLPPRSEAIVDVLCDYCCETISSVPYFSYLNNIKTIKKFACKNCAQIKLKDVMRQKYGVDNAMQIPEIKQKIIDTNMEKYGVDNYAKTKECQEKIKNTMISRYGVEHALQYDDFNNAAKNTCINRYGENYGEIFHKRAIDSFRERTGYDSPAKSPESLEKIKQTCIERYGVDNPAKSPEIQMKISKTLYENSSQRASLQQRYICDLYGGVLNYPINRYNADVYLQQYNLVIEYDGGGHKLSVIMDDITQEEFNQKEIVRNNVIKHEGYKQMRIISSKDLLPSDTILLQMLGDARQYFNEYPDHSWIEFNIDTSSIRNAENKDGVSYDFGELRRIKKAA